MLPTYWTNHARISQSYQGACGRKKIAFVLVLVPWYSVVGIVDLILSTYFLSCTMPVVHWRLSSKPPHC